MPLTARYKYMYERSQVNIPNQSLAFLRSHYKEISSMMIEKTSFRNNTIKIVRHSCEEVQL